MKFVTKIFIAIFVSTAFIIGGMSGMTHFWIVRHQINEIISHSKELAMLAALKSEDYILRNERVELYQFFESIVNVDPYIDYIFVEKDHGVLIHTFDTGVPKGLLNLGSLGNSSAVDMQPIQDNQGNLIYHLRINIGSPAHSVLHLGVSDAKIRDKLHRHRNLLLMIGCLLLAIVPFCLALFLSRLVSTPLDILRKGVARIGSGKLDFRLDLPTGDEIEELAGDINSMAENLEKFRQGLTSEIAERKQAQKELARQSDLLSNILQNVPHHIFWKNRESVYMGCNRSFARAVGLEDDVGIQGKTDDELPWGKEKATFYRKCDQTVMDTGTVIQDIEDTLIRADGRKESVIMNIAPLRDRKGYIFGVMGLYYDITERKTMEETIKQSQKMEAIGTLAGGIAHDFNNILGSIIGYAELAKDETGKESVPSEYLNQILISSFRAKELVRQILTFCRKNKEEQRPIQVSSIVKEVLKLLGSTLPTTIEIRQHIEAPDSLVNADPTQLHQIVMNLCTNAAHAMKKNGGCLSISLSEIEVKAMEARQKYHGVSPGIFVMLSISDTGTGIDSDHLHRIFEPFFTTKDKEMGTGMGLAVVHGIVKQLGGDILVESEWAKGTRFQVILPRVFSRSQGEKIPTGQLPTGQGRILFVDDEKILLDLGEKILGSLGYQVTAVNGSIEALQLYQKSPDAFNLIITDHTMPHLTGFEMSRQILKLNPEARILLCTGFNDTITPEKVEAIGIRALLYKPFSRKELGEKVQEILES